MPTGDTLTSRERVLLLIARETLVGCDGLNAKNLRGTFEFDVVPVIVGLCRDGVLTVSRASTAEHIDWRDGALGVVALLAHDDTVVRVDAGIDDYREGMT